MAQQIAPGCCGPVSGPIEKKASVTPAQGVSMPAVLRDTGFWRCMIGLAAMI